MVKTRIHIVTGIQLDDLYSLIINLKILDPFENQYKDAKCPYCGSEKKSLKISPETMVNYSFGDNKKVADKYVKK